MTEKETVVIKPGMRVRHKRLGDGTAVQRSIDPYSKVNYDDYQIALVIFDSLPEGYSNPFTVDWEALTPI